MAYYWLYNTSNDNIYILILIIIILALIIVNFKMWTKKTDRFFDVPGAKWINKGTGADVIVTQAIYNASLGVANGEDPNLYTKTSTGQIIINGISYTYASPPPFFGVSNGVNTNYNTVLDVNALNTAGQAPTNANYTYIYVVPISANTPTTTPISSNTPTTTPISANTPTTTPISANTPTTTPISANTPTTTPISSNTQSPTTTRTPTTTPISSNTTTTTKKTPTTTRIPTTTKKTPTTTRTPTTTQPPRWINLETGIPVTVTQQIYDKSIVEGLSNYYNKINSGTIIINGNTYKYVSPAPFTYGTYNYNIIKDVDAFNANLDTNPNDSNYIYIYVTPISIINYPTTTTSNNPSTTNTSNQPTLPLCHQPTLPLCIDQNTNYENSPLNPNFYISPEEQARRNAWSQLDGDEGSLPNTNGTPTYKNDITYSGGLLNNSSSSLNLPLTYSTIGDYATLDSLGAKLTDTIGGINSNLGYTILDEQLGTFNNYNATPTVANTPRTYDNTANYNTGMNPYTVNGVSSSSGTVSGQGSGISGKITQDHRPFFMQKDFDGVSNIFAPNIIISNPPLTEDGNPDISFEM
jgi:hypothetical protein